MSQEPDDDDLYDYEAADDRRNAFYRAQGQQDMGPEPEEVGRCDECGEPVSDGALYCEDCERADETPTVLFEE